MRQLLSSEIAAMLGAPPVFANANAGSKLYICATQQPNDLDLTGYEMLVWVEIKAVGSHGEGGSATNILTYDTWDTDVIQKAKGMTDAGSPEIELARLFDDPGQVLLRSAALTPFYYAFKMVRNDKLTANGTNTIIYNRGLITGPRRPFGRNEDFDLEVFTLALVQRETLSNPGGTGSPPVAGAAPVLSGTIAVGSTVTTTNGTVTGTVTSTTYQWYSGGMPIDGATGNTFVITAAQQGKNITSRVRSANANGSVIAFSAPSIVVP